MKTQDSCWLEKKQYYTGKKLTAEQAKAEIKFAVDIDPKIYAAATQPFDKVWARFGKQIEEHGLGHYSKVVLMIAQASNPVGLREVREEKGCGYANVVFHYRVKTADDRTQSLDSYFTLIFREEDGVST